MPFSHSKQAKVAQQTPRSLKAAEPHKKEKTKEDKEETKLNKAKARASSKGKVQGLRGSPLECSRRHAQDDDQGADDQGAGHEGDEEDGAAAGGKLFRSETPSILLFYPFY